MTAVVGEKVTLPCSTNLSTPVDWHYLPSTNASSRLICSAGHVHIDYRRRFILDRNVTSNFNLVILNVSHEDAGEYICREDIGLGPEHRVMLHVDVYGKIALQLLLIHVSMMTIY